MKLTAEPPSGIALFDLDGTLIPWDCQLLFRHHVTRREPWRRVLLPIFLGLLPFYPILKTEGMKRVFLSYLWGMPPEKVKEYSRDFAASVMPAIYSELKEEISRHRREGHLLVLTSASPEFYVSEIGALLGFDEVYGTVVVPGELFPDLTNHKGMAKVKRLREMFPESYFEGEKLRNCYGYTDSTADLPMLGLCQQALLVNPKSVLEEMGRRHDWKVVRPARPWKSKTDHIIRSLKLLLGVGKDPGGLGKTHSGD